MVMSVAGTAELQNKTRLVLDQLEYLGTFGIYANPMALINRSVVFSLI